jgi:hypothetical protein
MAAINPWSVFSKKTKSKGKAKTKKGGGKKSGAWQAYVGNKR